MWALFPLAMLLGGHFKTGGVGLGNEGVVEGWGEFNGKKRALVNLFGNSFYDGNIAGGLLWDL